MKNCAMCNCSIGNIVEGNWFLIGWNLLLPMMSIAINQSKDKEFRMVLSTLTVVFWVKKFSRMRPVICFVLSLQQMAVQLK